ncbi:hypothetical protein AVEN_61973-1, partial [Araneus ventricosus]
MRSRRISKRVLASPGGIAIAGVEIPPPVIVCTSFERSRAVVGEVYLDSGLSTRVAAAVIERPRVLRQVGGNFVKVK